MALYYEVDIQTPTTIKGDDGWKPVLLNEISARRFEAYELAVFLDDLQRTNATLPYRVRQVITNDNIRRIDGT